MNYRHAYHAGNFADVLKHVVLTRILAYLALKDKPFRVIDTHAGIGLYDLDADEASRTGEWIDGIGRLAEPLPARSEPLIAPYRRVLSEIRARYGAGTYPGSPAIIREMLRPQDRGILVELHPADHAVLAQRYHQVSNLKALNLDGWQALSAMIPPKEKRGLVLIDPPYEKPGELERLARELASAVGKWPSGIYAGWYPIKRQREVDDALAPLACLPRPVLRLEMRILTELPQPRLIGNGLVIVNPPFTLEDEMRALMPDLATRLEQEPGAGRARIERLGAPA
jgi:23S rRNA (adenine2030-N6)-methyltransferase